MLLSLVCFIHKIPIIEKSFGGIKSCILYYFTLVIDFLSLGWGARSGLKNNFVANALEKSVVSIHWKHESRVQSSMLQKASIAWSTCQL